MSVNLSPVAGAAAQFLDNSGNVLTGGKLYTYAAGTTTPQATYTSGAGVTFHSNPIILDAAGRVPAGGEIWLTDGLSYKFVLKDANDVLIGTWDNLIGINSNFLNYFTQEETQTATQGQTVFTLATVTYTPGTNSLSVYVNGSKQIVNDNYYETDATTVTFASGLNVGDVVDFTTAVTLSSGVTDASLVTYDPPYTASTPTTVELKLAQYVSVQDFGAVGDGVANDTTAINNAIGFVSTNNGGTIYFPAGTYKVTSSLTIPDYVVFLGAGKGSTILKRAFTGDFISSFGGYCGLQSLTIDGQTATYGAGRGVVMPTAISPDSFMLLVEIKNFVGSCLEFTTPDAGATFRATMCDFYTTGTVGTQAAVTVNTTDTVATSRHFTNCESGGCTLYNFGGCNDLYVTGGYSNSFIFGSSSSKVMINNMRVGSTGVTTIDGSAHQISNCVFANSVVISGNSIVFNCQVPSYNITNNGIGNSIQIQPSVFTSTWSQSSGTPPALGNGTLATNWNQDGFSVNINMALTMGSTTTYGDGTTGWTFTLPVKNTGQTLYFPAQIVRASAPNTYYQCTVQIAAGATTLGFGSAGQSVRGGFPFTWAAGDAIYFSGTYFAY